ncbi:hypothetical protein [Pedobacter sandarakinus]|uniref:hypothetical protein n=1 Tax=Pedobacter sandarakinus TaxID=353156 RepID=UPI0022486981|nr:hypothetical protein [Pedobacter sandarakinus]MCX2573342.1 hypothetical protein [Pedobacter sandarakinus]
MKNQLYSFTSIALLILLCLSSCSTNLKFLNSTVVPAAKGSVNVSKDNNGNFKLALKVDNLAEPSRLTPKKTMYVVWMVTAGNVTKNLGRLNSSSGYFSSSLEGSLSTVTPFKPEYVFITAENSAAIQYPTGLVVLTTK